MKRYTPPYLYYTLVLLLFSLLIPSVSLAQSPESATEVLSSGVSDPQDLINILVLSICVFIVLALLFMLYLLNVLLTYSKPAAERKPFFEGIMKKLSDAVPVEEEHEIMTDHDYDGIRELDNNLPLWWKYMFYATIVSAFIYMYYYHFDGGGKLQEEEYAEEVLAGEKAVEAYMKLSANSVDETNVKVVTDTKRLESGKALYLQNCAACHGKNAEGGVGPNLTDEYWMHGGSVQDIFKTIKYGVPQKGMISWKSQLSPGNIQEVTSFIMTLKGTQPENAKEPQGDKYEETVQE